MEHTMKRLSVIIGTAATAAAIALFGGGSAQAETNNTQTDYYVVDSNGHQHGDDGFVYEYLNH